MLKANGSHTLIWSVDVSFAVHEDFCSHAGGTLTMGRGAIASISAKQKVNTRSSTDAEVVGIDDSMGPILWTRCFLEEQGCEVMKSIQRQLLHLPSGHHAADREEKHSLSHFFWRKEELPPWPSDSLWRPSGNPPIREHDRNTQQC